MDAVSSRGVPPRHVVLGNADRSALFAFWLQIDCKTCADFPYQCGTFDNDCGTTIQCTCPADKPFCIQSNQLLDLGNPGYCSDKNIDPTDILDVSITKNGPDTAQVIGVEFDFELIVRVEQGSRGANSVVVTDTLPAGLTLVSTAAGE